VGVCVGLCRPWVGSEEAGKRGRREMLLGFCCHWRGNTKGVVLLRTKGAATRDSSRRAGQGGRGRRDRSLGA
jgi:hypothetical protein